MKDTRIERLELIRDSLLKLMDEVHPYPQHLLDLACDRLNLVIESLRMGDQNK